LFDLKTIYKKGLPCGKPFFVESLTRGLPRGRRKKERKKEKIIK
jgi:hypothetical protein